MSASVIEQIQSIENLRQAASWKRDQWLRDRGWESTCETPGSLWLWKRLWSGRSGKDPHWIIVDADLAERMQKEWDFEQDYNEHPENYEE